MECLLFLFEGGFLRSIVFVKLLEKVWIIGKLRKISSINWKTTAMKTGDNYEGEERP